MDKQEDKKLPRFEQWGESGNYVLIFERYGRIRVMPIEDYVYMALCEIAGHVLPIEGVYGQK